MLIRGKLPVPAVEPRSQSLSKLRSSARCRVIKALRWSAFVTMFDLRCSRAGAELAAGLGAAYESHRRSLLLPRTTAAARQVTPLGFIPVTRGESSGVTPALITALTDL